MYARQEMLVIYYMERQFILMQMRGVEAKPLAKYQISAEGLEHLGGTSLQDLLQMLPVLVEHLTLELQKIPPGCNSGPGLHQEVKDRVGYFVGTMLQGFGFTRENL